MSFGNTNNGFGGAGGGSGSSGRAGSSGTSGTSGSSAFYFGTTTTTNIFNLQVGSSSSAACNSPILSVNATSDTGVYCTANLLTSSGFNTLANGNYFVSYLGEVLNINIASAPTSIATVYSGGCTPCIGTTTTTTSTTTATPPPPTSTTTTTTTSTTTATPPPPTSTTTTTTTSTTTSGFINVTFYAELNAASANAHNLWYSTDAWATSALVSATNIGTVGGLIGTVVVPRGATVYAAVGNNLDITASTAVSGKVSVTPNDYAALPLACGGSVSVTEFVDFTWNILANSLSFNLACTP